MEEGELCVCVTGLYVPFEQNFVIETKFYFCPDVRCIKCPPWTNLKSPSVITADSTLTNEILDGLNLGQIKVIRDT